MKGTAIELQKLLRKAGNPIRAKNCARFFKTGKGEYGYGDKFLGVTVPNTRALLKPFKDLSLKETEKLLKSPWHEERLAGVIILSHQAKSAKLPKERKQIADFYIKHAERFNNWDLVDVSVEYCLGLFLADLSRKQQESFLKKLITSKNLWKRRMAMVATFHFSRRQISDLALWVALQLINDNHDLIHKASGWMHREYCKRTSEAKLVQFLKEHAHKMPRTMLRYAIERLHPEMKIYFMKR
jgi:3-methyladenine DNA glycosylase AlkD